jgi:uncharacterized protein YjiK
MHMFKSFAGSLQNIFYTGLIVILAGCGASDKESYTSPTEYDLNNPYKINISTQLDEISGIDFYEKDTSVFAIVDEEGWLYKFFLKSRLIQKWKFGKNDDYEDLKRVDSAFYIMNSKGDITRVIFGHGDSLSADVFLFPENGNNEFESLYYDKERGMLHLICKDCGNDKAAAVSIWSFNPRDGSYILAPFSIDVSPIAQELDVSKVRFKPSSSAVHPETGEIYMISAVNKVLVVADKKGLVKHVYKLNPSIYKQPEGISFSPTGDLLISNEINLGEYATILIFKRKV